MARAQRILYSGAVYPIWGPLALRLNVMLYGHRYAGDGWIAVLWKKTPWGRRGVARRQERNLTRQRRASIRRSRMQERGN